MKRKNISYILLAAGIAIIALGILHPSLGSGGFNIVVTDASPPVFYAAYPDKDSSITTFSAIQVGVYDPESGITSVHAVVDGTGYDLTLNGGDPFSQSQWLYRLSTPITASGQHSFVYTATNGVGLTASYSGSFTIYTGLVGRWYVNDLLVSSPSQVMKFQTLTVTFLFIKESGADDSRINCMVVEGANQILALTYGGSGKWSGSYTFTGGSHTLALRASDGTNTVTMSLLGVDFGGVFTTEQMVELGVGGIFSGLGAFGLLSKRKFLFLR